MKKTIQISTLKEVLYICLISVIGITAIVFTVLYIDTFNTGFFAEYSTIVTAVTVSLITVLTVLTITFINYSKKFVYKLFLLTIIIILSAVVLLYILKRTGFLNKINSVDDFREYISSFGNFAVLLFILIQFLQVVILPIPAFITVGAGVLLFGPLKGAILSCVGIILGSIVGFAIGRIFGYKVAKWLIGKETLDKGLKFIKGKDKIVLTFMFLFPFFPDDVLCFVAGITTMSPLFFSIMIFTTRIITIFVSSFSMNNNIIPYDTWWGLILWILFFALTVVLTIIIYKHGEKFEKLFKKRKKKKQ